MEQSVVVKFTDGKTLRGTTFDIGGKDTFHLITNNKESMEIHIDRLKAVFFLKPPDWTEGELTKSRYGKKILVQFQDGEEISGTSYDYQQGKNHFFLFPLENKDSNERILVNRQATRNIKTVGATYDLSQIGLADQQKSAVCKKMEHEIYKLLYNTALELNRPDKINDESFIMVKSVFLKKKVVPMLEQYQQNFTRTACRECLNEKLKAIQAQLGEQIYQVMQKITSDWIR